MKVKKPTLPNQDKDLQMQAHSIDVQKKPEQSVTSLLLMRLSSCNQAALRSRACTTNSVSRYGILLTALFLITIFNHHSAMAQSQQAATINAPLRVFMNKQKICEAIDVNSVQTIMKLQSKITTGSHQNARYSMCLYIWKDPEYGSLSVSLSTYNKNIENFPPQKLSESELNTKIEKILKQVHSSKAKAKIFRANQIAANKFEIINGLGDAATWLKTTRASILTVLIENTKLIIKMKKPPSKESMLQVAQHILKRQ